MTEYTTEHMCDFCNASASSIEDVQHASGCPELKILSLSEALARLHIEHAKLRAGLELIQSGLRGGVALADAVLSQNSSTAPPAD